MCHNIANKKPYALCCVCNSILIHPVRQRELDGEGCAVHKPDGMFQGLCRIQDLSQEEHHRRAPITTSWGEEQCADRTSPKPSPEAFTRPVQLQLHRRLASVSGALRRAISGKIARAQRLRKRSKRVPSVSPFGAGAFDRAANVDSQA